MSKRPISLWTRCANHSAPSGPTVIDSLEFVSISDSGYAVTLPPGTSLPIPPWYKNQRLPPATVSASGCVTPLGSVVSVIVPDVVMRPIFAPQSSVNHKAPSGPVTIADGKLRAVGIAYSVNAPAVVIRPMLFVPTSQNHNAPSGPIVIAPGLLPALNGNSVIAPVVAIRPTSCVHCSVNHKAPSGPEAIPRGWLEGWGKGYAAIA